MAFIIALWFGVARAAPKHYLVTPKSAAARAALIDRAGPAYVERVLSRVGLLVVRTDDERALRADPRVAAVEVAVAHTRPGSSPSNPLTQSAAVPWGVNAVDAPAAWPLTRGRGARVMVLDSGADAGHPALRARVEAGRNFVGERTEDYADREGHGTHVAGTLLGVAPEVRLLIGRICGANACGSVAIASGLDWAIAERVDVVNLSIAGDTLTRAEARALKRAEEAGVIVVAASGNDGVGVLAYPASVETVLAVGAMNARRLVPEFSQWGPQLAVVAPGTDIYSALPRGRGRTSAVRLDGVDVASRAVDGSGVDEIDAEISDLGPGRAEDFDRTDVRHRVALVNRGPRDFREMVELAVFHGARAVLIANRADDVLVGSIASSRVPIRIPVARIDESTGISVRARLSAGGTARARVGVRATDYGFMQGSSMAVPHVAGTLALMRARDHDLSPAAARELVRRTATPIESGVNARSGRGLVDAAAAVRAVESRERAN